MESFESENLKRAKNEESKEGKEQYTSKIELYFFRHGEKEKAGKDVSDSEIEITEESKNEAMEIGERINPDQNNPSDAFGSSARRARDTAMRESLGRNSEITGEETPEELTRKLEIWVMDNNKKITGEETPKELTEKLNKELLGICSEAKTEKLLNYELDKTSEFGERSYEHMKKSRDYLKFLVEESDDSAKKTNDENGPTYKRLASNIASILDKYIRTAQEWDKIIQDNKNKYPNALMKIFLSSHTGVLESFLAKVIEETKDKNERDKFVEALNNQGFDTLEGFNIEILNKDSGDADIHISYKKEKDGEVVFEFDEIVESEIIRDMIIEEQKK